MRASRVGLLVAWMAATSSSCDPCPSGPEFPEGRRFFVELPGEEDRGMALRVQGEEVEVESVVVTVQDDRVTARVRLAGGRSFHIDYDIVATSGF